VRDVLTGRYDVARSRPLAPGGTAEAANVPAATSAPLVIAPDTAGITSAFADAVPSVAPAAAQKDNQIFHGLFADAGRGGPVASIVSQLWTAPSLPPAAANAAAGAAAPPPASVGGNLLDLFRDPARGS